MTRWQAGFVGPTTPKQDGSADDSKARDVPMTTSNRTARACIALCFAVAMMPYTAAGQGLEELAPGAFVRVCETGAECVAGLVWYHLPDTLGLKVQQQDVRIPLGDIDRVSVPINLPQVRRSGAIRGGVLGAGIGAAAALLAVGGFVESGDLPLVAGTGILFGAPIGAFLGASTDVNDSNLVWRTYWRR
jgi:hypothetical protein